MANGRIRYRARHGESVDAEFALEGTDRRAPATTFALCRFDCAALQHVTDLPRRAVDLSSDSRSAPNDSHRRVALAVDRGLASVQGLQVSSPRSWQTPRKRRQTTRRTTGALDAGRHRRPNALQQITNGSERWRGARISSTENHLSPGFPQTTINPQNGPLCATCKHFQSLFPQSLHRLQHVARMSRGVAVARCRALKLLVFFCDTRDIERPTFDGGQKTSLLNDINMVGEVGLEPTKA